MSNVKLDKFLKKIHFLRILTEKTWLYSIILFLALIAVVFLSYHLAFWQKVYPGIKIGEIVLSGKTQQEVEFLISARANFLENQDLVFSTPSASFKISPQKLGLAFKTTKTAQDVYQTGRSGDFWQDLQTKWRAYKEGIHIKTVYQLKEEVLEQKLAELEKLFEKGAVSSEIKIEQDKVVITPSKYGQKMETERLKVQIQQKLATLSPGPISLPIVAVPPEVTEEGAQKAKLATEKALSKTLTLKYQNRTWILNPQVLYSLLTYQTPAQKRPILQITFADQSLTIVYLKPVKDGYPVPSEIEVYFDKDKIKNYVAGMATEIDQPARDASFRFEGGRVTVFQPNQDGQQLDILKTIGLMNNFLISPKTTPRVTIELPVKVTKARVTMAEVNNLGIRELLGRGISYFAGSMPGRVHNIKLAASRLSGLLIPPGETFSFNNGVGEISDKTGYQTAYIIERGRTIFGIGGGVCQVSTTFFRAALNAGLPILERHPHAYRVSYYEQGGFKPGLDATIYPPTVDLKIKNDTSNNILIQTSVDEARQSLVFEFYGTSDGRKVEVTNPVIHSQSPPPPDLYEEDSSLPRGVKRQVDFAAWGARTSFKRKVVRGSEVLIEETFWSNYQPWRAIYLIGTKD